MAPTHRIDEAPRLQRESRIVARLVRKPAREMWGGIRPGHPEPVSAAPAVRRQLRHPPGDELGAAKDPRYTSGCAEGTTGNGERWNTARTRQGDL